MLELQNEGYVNADVNLLFSKNERNILHERNILQFSITQKQHSTVYYENKVVNKKFNNHNEKRLKKIIVKKM